MASTNQWPATNTNTTDNMAAAALPVWIPIFDNIELATAILGVLANLGTLVTLTANGGGFSDIIRLLFKCQSVLDCFCSLEAALLFILPLTWLTGDEVLDVFVCQTWHTQFGYWLTLGMSVWNLVVLALERYLCVCHPLKYQLMRLRHFRLIILGMVLLSVVFLIPALFQARLVDGQCRNELYWDTAGTLQFFYIYGIFCFFAFYAAPCALFFVLYGMIIANFRQRAKAQLGASSSSAVIDTASNQLTKTTIVVTVVFIITIGFALWYYLLAKVGLFEYVINTPLQKTCVFFSVVNSVVNPFIYATFMPVYRQAVRKTFLGPCKKN